MTSDAYADSIRKLVDQAPPIPQPARVRLAAIFRPTVVPIESRTPARQPAVADDLAYPTNRGVAA